MGSIIQPTTRGALEKVAGSAVLQERLQILPLSPGGWTVGSSESCFLPCRVRTATPRDVERKR